MLKELWTIILYDPLRNALVFLISIIPGADLGIAVIILTLLVKLILSPLSKKSIKSQAALRKLEPEIKKIKEKYKEKEEQAKRTFQLYKEHKVNPFAGCLLIIIQLPIIIALYLVFLKGLDFGTGTIYSFISVPESVKMSFLGLIDMQGKSLLLAILAGLSQFAHTRLSMPKSEKPEGSSKSFQENLKKSMNLQMRYFLPIFIAIIAYRVPAAVALYWVTSNIFLVGQELLVRRAASNK